MSREGSEVVLYEIVRGVIHWHRIFPLYRRSVRWPFTFFFLLHIKRDNGSTILRCIGPSGKMNKPENYLGI